MGGCDENIFSWSDTVVDILVSLLIFLVLALNKLYQPGWKPSVPSKVCRGF